MTNTTIKTHDAEFCGSLPLNLINMVQPHGILLVTDHNLNIVQVSANVLTSMDIQPNYFVDTSIDKYMTSEQVKTLKQKVLQLASREKLPLNMSLTVKQKDYPFLALVHIKNDHYIFELEPLNPENISFISFYQEIRYVMAALEQGSRPEETAHIAVREIKKLSGFDRVMIYKFDEQWNGNVIAEEREEDMEPYLGLRFPSSDIPKQARDLYQRNAYRFIPDRDYEGVKLYPVINPITNGFTDLSDCNLRGVAPVHIEYLTNMNVAASMSTRIMRNGQLWGLIACHHKAPKHLSYEMCSAFELISGVLSDKIAGGEAEKDFSFRTRIKEQLTKVLERLFASRDLVKCITDEKVSLMQLLDLTGAAIIYNNRIVSIGEAPSEEEIRALREWLGRKGVDKVFATPSLAREHAPSNSFNEAASGLIALPIFPQKGEYILGFRPEVQQTVNWGGNPNETIHFEEDKKNYHPRNSFAIWKETVKQSSLPWHPAQVNAAETLRNAILEQLLMVRS